MIQGKLVGRPRCFDVIDRAHGSSLSPQQPATNHIDIRTRRCDFKPMQILRQTAVTCLAKSKDVLDNPEEALDLGAYPRLVAVLSLLPFVDRPIEPVALVGKVSRTRRVLVDQMGLTVITLVTPHARLLAV